MRDYARYVAVLERGGVVACATETWMGLLADAGSWAAVQRVVSVKGRAADAPIALLLPDLAAVEQVAEPLQSEALDLARKHWPGPLTLVTHARAGLAPPLVRDGRVGFRVPGPSPAFDLVRQFGHPLTATSANLSGEPPARTAAQVEAGLGVDVDAVIPGEAPGGAPSTVLDVAQWPPRVLREGATPVLW